jgi:membrane-bound lytic murein transglycosylase B
MRERREVITAVIAGVVGVALLAATFLVFVQPRIAQQVQASAPGPRWAPRPAAPPVAAGPDTVGSNAGIQTLVEPKWATEAAAATGIPKRAVLAYAGATLAKAESMPDCKLSWTTLAAIGDVESSNGQHGGSSIGANGKVTPPIFGVALDGNGVARIPDSDDGTIDNDAKADRAVGPMQLIPQTWLNWHTDGNADGLEDPQNIYDSVMAATNYLCRSSTGLDTEKGWRTAISAYNLADSYLSKVASVAMRYNADAARVTG